MSSPRPSTPDFARPSTARAASYSVAPKSEILRNALHARRAQQSSTPTPVEKRPPPPESQPSPVTAPIPHASPDVFDQFELSEEQTRPVSPINRRRTSDVGVPRPKTTRQLNQENERLRAALMDTNMRVQLLKTNNSELQEENTKLKEKVEEIDPLEQENESLWHENNALKVKMEDLEQEMEDLKDGNENLRISNEEMISVLNECTAQMDGLESAMQEAVDTIFALESEKTALETKQATWEKEKAALSEEVQFLKERMSNLEYNSTLADSLVDGSQRCPSRIYSIDEARPSTSHFDSDYFSQPDSPVVKPSRESVISVTPSERSKKFLDLTQERRQSARDLAKRMSTASLKALRVATLAPAPEVPEIPIKYQQQTPKIVEENMPVRQTRQRRSDSDIGTAEAPHVESSEWASMPPPPKPARASVISQSSLTSSVDAQDDKDRWWKSIQPLTQQQPQPMPLPAQTYGPRPTEVPPSPTLTRSKTFRQLGHGQKLDTAGISGDFQSLSVGNESRKTRTQPSSAATTPRLEKDFLFNASEDADTFMRKAKAKLTGRK
ncbi:hypothetical protein IQ06DRAFT_328892 [Phaeosphaeriaceae sp. SRC1lsM3a]|nr:hypothetical protein IQ06DRAFT_328892 [Stagonospora sp. SRC1lsM3a]